MPLAPELIAAYETAEYAVAGLVLRVGERSDALDALLDSQAVAVAAFMTAANPRSVRLPARENAARMQALEAALRKAGHAYLHGEGRDPQGKWLAEPSLLALGIARPQAEALGRAFAQNAILFIERGRPPELVTLA
jgi:hypothetical protein